MMRVASVAVVLFVAFCLQAEPPAAHYYVQLILATDSTAPPSARAKLAGPKLSRRLDQMLKAKTLWEMRRREVMVHPGHVAKVSLSTHRDVEIEVSGSKRVVTTFYKGRAITRQTIPRGGGMTVIGDCGAQDRLWFVVVRRDEPGSWPRRLRAREAIIHPKGEQR